MVESCRHEQFARAFEVSSRGWQSGFSGTCHVPFYLGLRPIGRVFLGRNIWPKVSIRLESFAITAVSV